MSAPDAVVLDGLSAGYGGRPLWTGLDLQVREGEFLTVLGGNGAGKTTLLRVLLGLLRPLAGTVLVQGTPVRRGDPRVGYVSQQAALGAAGSLRGTDLVRLGLDGHRWGPSLPSRRAAQAVAEALEAVGAERFAGLRAGRLSGGQLQRVRIAQALVGDPALVLADEPFASLDPSAAAQVAGLLDARRRAAGTTTIVVTHDVNPVLGCTDRVLYLTPGGRWAAGAPDEVLTGECLSRLYGREVDVVRARGAVVVVGAAGSGDHPTLERTS